MENPPPPVAGVPSLQIDSPIDIVRLALDEKVVVKLRGERQLAGRLHAFDQHLNMVLGNVTESVKVAEIDEVSGEEVSNIVKRTMPMLFVRGDGVILISPNSK